MGRIWSIGPQQTLYIPGCWLKKGRNEIIVLDVVGPDKAESFGQDKPELDKLNINRGNSNTATWTVPANASKQEWTFAPGNGWQKVNFSSSAKGRYLAIECKSTHDGGDVVSIAEIYALGSDGSRMSREPWTVKYVSSEDIDNGNKTGDKVYDLQESTYWSSRSDAKKPHVLVIDLGNVQTVNGIEYLPRAEKGAPGSIKDCNIYVY
jgi:beta-galactosidase